LNTLTIYTKSVGYGPDPIEITAKKIAIVVALKIRVGLGTNEHDHRLLAKLLCFFFE
jgi:hypothetical protein